MKPSCGSECTVEVARFSVIDFHRVCKFLERAEDLVLQIEGALVLSGGLDDPTPFRRLLRKISKEFLAPD
jgi:hypothetical protein